ncbi:MAG: hypothetical protein ACR2RE_13810 [Geminicoccaceae bacterium]
MLFRGMKIKFLILIIGVFSLAGCKDPDERKTHYITVYLSQDVEIKEVLIDLEAKKPGVLVEHPEGVEVKHRPTKPRPTVSFEPVAAGVLGVCFILLNAALGPRSIFAHRRESLLRRLLIVPPGNAFGLQLSLFTRSWH